MLEWWDADAYVEANDDVDSLMRDSSMFNLPPFPSSPLSIFLSLVLSQTLHFVRCHATKKATAQYNRMKKENRRITTTTATEI